MFEEILTGNRRALAQAITLVESSSPSDLEAKEHLQQKLQTWKSSNRKACLKIGFSGPPGAGKSSLIESFGQYLLEQNKSLAIVAVDPSSPLTKGSLMGDKTRMQGLARHPNAFIRPSPSKGQLGGLSPHIADVISLCEAAGFDIVIVESVGVGQSESEIAGLVDRLALIVPPAAGDELQAFKRGLFELADLIVVNKADGDLAFEAEKTKLSFSSAFKLMARPTPVLSVSAHQKSGFGTLWTALSKAVIIALLITGGCRQTSDSNLITKLESQNPKIARQALVALTQKPDPKALNAIIRYSENKNADDRIGAILAIRQLGDKRAIPWLFVLSTGHLDERVQNAAAEALTFLENQDR